jgi:hypothetical protein
MNFQQFIMAAKVRDNVRGDFIEGTRLLIKCDKFPASVTRRDELHAFMVFQRQACRKAVATGRKVWREFERRELKELLS